MNIILTSICIFFLFSCTASDYEHEEVKTTPKKESYQLKAQETCPYQGIPIDPYKYVEYKGQRIYVCCYPCLKIVKKDPEKAIKILKDQFGERLLNNDEHVPGL